MMLQLSHMPIGWKLIQEADNNKTLSERKERVENNLKKTTSEWVFIH